MTVTGRRDTLAAMTTLISPSILASDFSRLAEEVQAVERAGADWIHVDVMDGHFVPPITIGADVTKSLSRVTRLPLDVHLMVEKPEQQVDQFIDAGAYLVTVHAEATSHLDRLLRHIKGRGVRAGVSLNPATPISALEHVLELADLVLIMSVNPGYGGQPFLDYSLEKVRRLKERIQSLGGSTLIEVDGGVKTSNAQLLVRAGADVLVAGTAIFHTRDYAAAIAQLKTENP